MTIGWGPPKRSVEAECARRGRSQVVAGCIELLGGRPVDDELLIALGGPTARAVLSGRAGGRTGHWPRVWAARGLLHVWDERATRAIVRAATDDSWRVREKVAQIVAAHRVDAVLHEVVRLRHDPIPRVRVAAERALRNLADNTG
jgi:hypothetical protein